MKCDVCHEEIKEPFHMEINPILVRHDPSFAGGFSYSPEDRGKYTELLRVHLSCWKSLLGVKTGKVMAIAEASVVAEINAKKLEVI